MTGVHDGPIYFLLMSAATVGFVWDPHIPGWCRPGLSYLSTMTGPIQHFRSAVVDAWRGKVSAGLCIRKGFRGGAFWIFITRNSSHVRERDKVVLRSIMVGGVWNGLGAMEGSICGGGCSQFAALGAYSSHLFLPDDFDAEGAAWRLLANINVWSHGSLVLDKVSGDGSTASGMYAHLSWSAWGHRKWVHLDLLQPELSLVCFFFSSWSFADCSAEFVGVILALQALDAAHVGVQNLNVVRPSVS